MSAIDLLRDALFGSPPSINYPPQKEGVLHAFSELADSIAIIGSFGGVGVFKTTRALLNADLAHDANVAAIVYDDATDANNDIYFKVGASGAGSWTLTTILHDLLDGQVALAVDQLETEIAAAVAAAIVTATAAAAGSATAAAGSATAAAGSATAAAGSATAAAGSAGSAAATLAAITTLEAAQYRFATKAAATAGLAGIPADEFVYVFADETRNGRVTVYRKTGGVLVFQNTLTGEPLTFFINPLTGSDAGPGTRAGPFATIGHAATLAVAGDTIEIAANAIIKEDFDQFFSFPNGITISSAPHGKAVVQCMDKIAGAWTADGDAWYRDVVHDFGYAPGAPVTSNNLNPRLIWRDDAADEYRALGVYSSAVAATAIAHVKANPGTFSPVDMTGGGSFQNSGWRTQTYRLYVRLPEGQNPNDLDAILYGQRFFPPLGGDSTLENVIVFGTIYRGGIQSNGPGGAIRRCELYWPAIHGFQTCGMFTEDCLLAHGGNGLGIHHFGSEANFAKQLHSHHLRFRAYDWQNALISCHGVGAGDWTIDTITFDEPHFENCVNLGDAYGIRTGITLNRPVLIDVGGIGGFGCSSVINDPLIYRTKTGTTGLFSVPTGAGQTCTINRGSAVGRASTFMRGEGGSLVLNETLVIAEVASYFLSNEGSFDDLIFNGGVLQIAPSQTPLGNGADIWQQPGSGAGVVTINGTVTSGLNIPHIQANPGAATLVTDTHTTFGGYSGMKDTGDWRHPIDIGANSPTLVERERVVATCGFVDYGGGNVSAGVLTSRRFMYPGGFNGKLAAIESYLFPAGFVPTCCMGAQGLGSSVFIFGKAGKVYRVLVNGSPTPYTAVAGIPADEDVTGLLRIPGIYEIMVFTWNGVISKAYTLNPVAMTILGTPADPGTAYPILGGVQDGGDSNLLIFGASANDAAGGALKSTDGGATWAAVDASFTDKPRVGAYVNGIFVLAGYGPNYSSLWTSATVGGAWTGRTLTDSSFESLAVDAARKRLIFTGPVATAPYRRFGPLDRAGWIDCSDANPANWPPAQYIEPPFGAVHSAVVIPNGVYDPGGNKPGLNLIGRSPLFASTSDTRGSGGWSMGHALSQGSTRLRSSSKLIENSVTLYA